MLKLIEKGRLLEVMQAIRKQTGVPHDQALKAIKAARAGDRSLLDACFEPDASRPGGTRDV
ncbi:hypothetical protein HDA40_006789 [Hamadaea flava]|nr:hypothetical protein [Hamadaea flava]